MKGMKLPSPALIVAVVALVAALAGSAVAQSDPEATSAISKKKTKKIAKKEAKKQIKKTLPIDASELGPITQVTSTTMIPQGENGTATATCSSGKVLSGGWEGPPLVDDGIVPDGIIPYLDKETNNGWTVSGFAVDTPATLTVYANCLGS